MILVLVFSMTSFVIFSFMLFVLVLELEIKAQKDNFEKQSYAIKTAAEVKLAEVQALLEAERVLHKTEVKPSENNVTCFGNVNSRRISKSNR